MRDGCRGQLHLTIATNPPISRGSRGHTPTVVLDTQQLISCNYLNIWSGGTLQSRARRIARVEQIRTENQHLMPEKGWGPFCRPIVPILPPPDLTLPRGRIPQSHLEMFAQCVSLQSHRFLSRYSFYMKCQTAVSDSIVFPRAED